MFLDSRSFHVEPHVCPDCQIKEARGLDSFGYRMPCANCAIIRLLKAFQADMDDPSPRSRKRTPSGITLKLEVPNQAISTVQ